MRDHDGRSHPFRNPRRDAQGRIETQAQAQAGGVREAAGDRKQRRYCDAFNLWRTCRRKSCRRLRACGGDPAVCLARGIDSIPREQQIQARAAILAATPDNISAPEREARQRTPRDCYE
jgi:hypothetical protein